MTLANALGDVWSEAVVSVVPDRRRRGGGRPDEIVALLSARERYGLGNDTSDVVVPELSLRSLEGRAGREDMDPDPVETSET